MTVATLARILDCSEQAIRSGLLPLLPAEAVRKERPMLIYGKMAVEIWARRQLAKESSGAAGDPMMEIPGVGSPALERYREARADLAELEVAERVRRLVDVEAFHGQTMRAASIIQGAGESLQREYGWEAYKILDDALVESLRILDLVCGHGS